MQQQFWENKIGEILSLELDKKFLSDFQQKFSGNENWGILEHDFVKTFC